MTYKEFLIYLEENFDGYAVFMERPRNFRRPKIRSGQQKAAGKKLRCRKRLVRCGRNPCSRFMIT